MAKIIIAGAGHGGLVAGALLAKLGHKVIALEKETIIGHDWEDRFPVEVLYDLIGEEVPLEKLRKRSDSTFLSPSEIFPIVVPFEESKRPRMMWRKDVLDKLLLFYKASGGEILFNVEVKSPIIRDGKVVGIETSIGNMEGDLIIDSLGIDSVIRKQLPKDYSIEADYQRGDAFYAYRAYFKRIPQEKDKSAPFNVYISHMGKQGISWYDGENSVADLLIGRIEPLDDNEIQTTVLHLKSQNPDLTLEILHGGQKGKIPVRRPLPKFIGNGYAAVGDSAYMTIPMNGMGIELSIKAGKLLANTVGKEDKITEELLWNYNVKFIKEKGGELAANEILKNTLLNLGPSEIDFLFKEKIINSKDLSGAGADMRLSVLLGKFIRGLKKPKTFFKLLNGIMLGKKAKKQYEKVPEKFDQDNVDNWIKSLEKYYLPINSN